MAYRLLRRAAYRLMDQVGIRQVPLHDTRHARNARATCGRRSRPD